MKKTKQYDTEKSSLLSSEKLMESMINHTVDNLSSIQKENQSADERIEISHVVEHVEPLEVKQFSNPKLLFQYIKDLVS